MRRENWNRKIEKIAVIIKFSWIYLKIMNTCGCLFLKHNIYYLLINKVSTCQYRLGNIIVNIKKIPVRVIYIQYCAPK